MAAKGLSDTVKQAMQDVIAPDLEPIKGELVGVRAELKAIDDRISASRNEMHASFHAVNDRIDTLRERVAETNRRVDDALEAKFAARG